MGKAYHKKPSVYSHLRDTALAFASSFLSVMVIGLLGPAAPDVIDDLGIGYARAGLFFIAGSLAFLFSTPLGGVVSDTPNRKTLFAIIALLLALGLVGLVLVPTCALILAAIFFFSLFGGAAISVGQSIMVDLYPAPRDRLLTMQALFAFLGCFTAPLLVALNFANGVHWAPVRPWRNQGLAQVTRQMLAHRADPCFHQKQDKQ